ncbi:spinster family MFS transporter [Sinimarinibacterium flocculans]|uniref:Sugar phosphate permease n=1 Tax=Sinimarinibacterium flocculans TaxID=985250 RepID=A0A318E7W8_9GAMM|nr:MFS transporter [Sinimarinibacterium flocculans]PXV65293.1 sugar phosphate permease [Sinimarinibacterium flocculans]
MSQTGERPASLAYPWFVVAILMVAYVFSFVDRQILNLLVGPIRADLGISDTQMSLLMGFSFAIFYTILGIPLARIADAKSRRGLIVAGIVVWSAMTALCGLAKHYWQLLLFRIGVGVGEAALSPAAYSMIADYFPPERRSTAMSVYSMGIFLGSGIAFLVGGLVVQYSVAQGTVLLPLLGEIRPWQMVFLILGASGIVFSFAFLLVREPKRQGVVDGQDSLPFSEVVSYLWANRRAVLSHNVGFAMMAMCSYGTTAWIPTYFIRSHGWTAAEIGVVLGLQVVVFACAGIIIGGRIADRWTRQGRSDAAMRVGVLSGIVTMIGGATYLLAPNGTVAAVALVVPVFALAMPFGAAPAALQEIVPNRMRGQTTAVYLFMTNMIGLGIGPTAIAVFTDYVFSDDSMLRWSMLIVASISLTGSMAILLSGMKPYRAMHARLHAG